MTDLLKPCPFCGVKLEPFGHDRNTAGEVIDVLRHPYNDDAETREHICPLSGLVFPADKWQNRPIEDKLYAENEKLKNDLNSVLSVLGEIVDEARTQDPFGNSEGMALIFGAIRLLGYNIE